MQINSLQIANFCANNFCRTNNMANLNSARLNKNGQDVYTPSFKGTGKIVTEIQDDTWKVANLTVGGKKGIHLRPASVIVRLVNEGRDVLNKHGFDDEDSVGVFLLKESDEPVDASSMISLLTNGFLSGDKVILKTNKIFPNKQYEEIANTILEPDQIEY